MQFRKSRWNALETNEASVLNKNRPILSNVLPDQGVPNMPVLDEVLPNQKTTFRDQDSTVDDNEEGRVQPTPVFAYKGTDKGVETKSEVTK